MAAAQGLDRRLQVDTLSMAERLSLRTNALDWILLTPNVGVEFDVRNTNWNRWAVGVNVRGNWQTKHTFKPGLVYNIAGARVEFRNYWRPRQIGDKNINRHHSFIDKAFSCRRTQVKHPDLLYYRGLYASYNQFSIKIIGDGYQGSAFTLGFTYGVVKPLYAFGNGNSLDLEFGVSAGLAMAKYNRYAHDRGTDCYPVTETVGMSLVKHPVLSDLHVGFVYRFGRYPVTGKYRWRYDCDPVFQARIDSIYMAEENARIERQTIDSVVTMIRADFKHDYDSIMAVKKVKADSLNRIKSAQAAEALKNKKAAAELERRNKEAAKAEAKAAKKGKKAKTPADSTATPNVPPVETTVPTEENATPTEETPAPTEENAAPTEETPAPTEETPAPTEENTTPTEENTTPTEENVAPTEETTAEETPAPTEEAPTEEPKTEDTKDDEQTEPAATDGSGENAPAATDGDGKEAGNEE